jgi:hypothetical protein
VGQHGTRVGQDGARVGMERVETRVGQGLGQGHGGRWSGIGTIGVRAGSDGNKVGVMVP